MGHHCCAVKLNLVILGFAGITVEAPGQEMIYCLFAGKTKMRDGVKLAPIAH
jgi:hypothetical protein